MVDVTALHHNSSRARNITRQVSSACSRRDARTFVVDIFLVVWVSGRSIESPLDIRIFKKK